MILVGSLRDWGLWVLSGYPDTAWMHVRYLGLTCLRNQSIFFFICHFMYMRYTHRFMGTLMFDGLVERNRRPYRIKYHSISLITVLLVSATPLIAAVSV